MLGLAGNTNTARRATGSRRVAGALTLALTLAGTLALAGCGSGDADGAERADADAAAEVGSAEVGSAETGADGGESGLGRVVTDDWDWSARTDGQIDAVPFPVYPESKLASFMVELEPGEPQALTLQTGDPLDQVVAFYAAELSGYSHRERYGSHFFWQGPDSFDPVEDTNTARVQVRASISSDGTFIDMFFPATGR